MSTAFQSRIWFPMILLKKSSGLYFETLEKYLFIGINEFGLKLSVHHWINDALMAIFFFFVTLEIKREFLQGELSNIKQAMLPIIAAVGELFDGLTDDDLVAEAILPDVKDFSIKDYEDCSDHKKISELLPDGTSEDFALGIPTILSTDVSEAFFQDPLDSSIVRVDKENKNLPSFYFRIVWWLARK